VSLSDERRRILKMVEEGKITADEGANLMEILEESASRDAEPPQGSGAGAHGSPDARGGRESGKAGAAGRKAESTGFILGGKGSFGEGSQIVIKTIERATGQETVNIRVPLKLAWMLGSIVPKTEREKLAARGIDIDSLLVMTENAQPGVILEMDDEHETERIIVVIE